MRAIQSVKPLANNISDAGLRQMALRMDENIMELHSSVQKLGKGYQPISPNQPIVVVRGGGGTGLENPAGGVYFVDGPSSNSIQSIVDYMGGVGTIQLGPGVYNESLVMGPEDSNIRIIGSGMNETIFKGSLDIKGSNAWFDNMWWMGTDLPYAMKIYRQNGGPDRNHFSKVRFGGNSSGLVDPAGDGPTGPGVWIDGGILNVFDHCLMAFNDGDGVYINTTSQSPPDDHVWSTNCNTFRDCTVNGNGGYGVKMEVGSDGVAGMQQNVFHGGNMENNVNGEVYSRSAFFVYLDNIDFESQRALTGPTLDIGGGTCIITNCSSINTGGTARFFIIDSSVARVTHCRIVGYTNMDVGVFTETCIHSFAEGNMLYDPINGDVITPRWISNRSSMWGYSA